MRTSSSQDLMPSSARMVIRLASVSAIGGRARAVKHTKTPAAAAAPVHDNQAPTLRSRCRRIASRAESATALFFGSVALAWCCAENR